MVSCVNIGMCFVNSIVDNEFSFVDWGISIVDFVILGIDLYYV